MGNTFRRLFDGLFGNREMRVVMLGLDAAGKTTILYKLHIGEVLSTVPTIGTHYFNNTDALIYVVDCCDRERIGRASAEFKQIIDDPLMRHSAILVFANKQDLPGALTPAETCEAMGLPALKGRKWHVQGAISTRGEGLYEGLDWLSGVLKTLQRVFLRWSDPSEAEGTMYSLNFGVEESPASEGSMLFTLLSELLEAGQQSAAALASMTAQHTELETRCMRVQRQLVAYADSDAQHRADTAVKVAALLNLHKARERELQAELDCLKQHAAHASLGTAGPSRGPAEAPAPMAEGVETSSGGGSMQGEERADEEEMSGVAASDTDHER
ncbi:ADP-ribosylation factor 1 [Auxenochlorella protothecoides]|uniref:ADP-ribosylation factor 1 n=1 Tax=Auxenochlorella protothecoides TaxID=3075 RepID=A0A087SPH0_AUXPR|nr:ADP-ribosylation factor 1 [Auxenochlorella protothecoides]KFM27624.1 ADP-ribosylation factor 1 [Auxenochlorella protothecoides]